MAMFKYELDIIVYALENYLFKIVGSLHKRLLHF